MVDSNQRYRRGVIVRSTRHSSRAQRPASGVQPAMLPRSSMLLRSSLVVLTFAVGFLLTWVSAAHAPNHDHQPHAGSHSVAERDGIDRNEPSSASVVSLAVAPGCMPAPACPRCSAPTLPTALTGKRTVPKAMSVTVAAVRSPVALDLRYRHLSTQEYPPARGARAQSQLGTLLI